MALSYTQNTGQLLGSSVTTLGGTSIDRISDAVTDASGNIYITGALGASGQGLNIKTVKLNSALSILWAATWNGAANLDDVANGIIVDPTGNVYVAGYTTNSSNTDAILIKYTSGGSLSWAQTHDGGGGDAFADLAFTLDDDVFVGGHTATPNSNKDFFVAVYSSSGAKRWSEICNGLPNRDEEIRYVNSDGAGNFLASGPSEQWDSSQQILTVKYARYSQVLPQNEGVNAPFVENRGQLLNTDNRPVEAIHYYSWSNYPNLYVFEDKVSFVFSHIDTVPTSLDTMTRLDLSFKNGLSTAATGLERHEDFHNYYLGHIPEGRERVSLENKVIHPGIYANIDALYGQGQDGFFLRIICKPGSTPGDISLQFDGQTAMSLQTDGSLLVETALESLILPAPTAILSSSSGVESDAGWAPAFVINGGGAVSITTRLVARLGLRGERSALLEENNLAPRVSLAYKFGANDQVSFAWGHFYQKGDSLLRWRGQFNSDVPGFQRAEHYILNYQYIKSDRTFRVEGFYKKYTNLITTLGTIGNNGKGYAKGVELFYRDKKTIPSFDFWLSYSWLDTKRKFQWYPIEVQPTYAANHVATLVAKKFFSKIRTSAGLSYSYSTGRPYFNPNRTTDEFLTDRTPAYQNLSINFNYLTSIRKAFTVIVFSVSNVLNQEQIFNYRYSPDGTMRTAISPAARQFFFVGAFISWGTDRRQEVLDNQN